MPAPATPSLAYAYLALADDVTDAAPAPRRRSVVVVAAAAATALALATPLGWGAYDAAHETAKATATLAQKAILAAPAPDDAG